MVQLAQPKETARLVLRSFQANDLDDLAAIFADVSVNRFLYTEPRSRDETARALDKRLGVVSEPDEDTILRVAVALPTTNRLVGDFMLRWSEDVHRQGEVGGSLHPDVHGRGYASEVYEALLEIAFTRYDQHRVCGRCDARNAPSVRSLEKVGLRREAHFVENEFVKGEWTDEIVLAILQNEWRAAHHSSE
ncbi:MAG TPA: GNAT family N-acetyltransferase [Acidimicrobiales bacterium]|nr:GNAT family N-acetyltransferase [Acidimicrobiales bacterium]